ncbi:MAG TPA: hemerythrin family protein [Woeseiaceae bacterium]|nr:hemerythrin family protein [Woeseiaceae bacterium]
MSLLAWKPEYSVGVPSVDDEHRELIDLINVVYDELDGRCDSVSVDEFLGDIHAVISQHFALEEQLMRAAGYDSYAAHKDDHEELLDQIRDLMDVVADAPNRGLEQLRKRLSDWFSGHFSTHDARLHGKLGI